MHSAPEVELGEFLYKTWTSIPEALKAGAQCATVKETVWQSGGLVSSWAICVVLSSSHPLSRADKGTPGIPFSTHTKNALIL